MWPWYATGLETEEELAKDQQVDPIVVALRKTLCIVKAASPILFVTVK